MIKFRRRRKLPVQTVPDTFKGWAKSASRSSSCSKDNVSCTKTKSPALGFKSAKNKSREWSAAQRPDNAVNVF
jgi:hypothetical protein